MIGSGAGLRPGGAGGFVGLGPSLRLGTLRLGTLCLGALCLGAVACSDARPVAGAGEVRTYTYPPDFRYISQDELQSTMWRLAAEVAQLDQLLLAGQGPEQSAPSPEKLDAVLRQIEGNARKLHTGARSSNHPMLNDHLDRFLETVKRARHDLQRDPPQYAASGAVAGACAQCHDLH